MKSGISHECARKTWEAFRASEEIVTDRLLQQPGWPIDAREVQDVLSTGYEQRVRALVDDLRRRRLNVLSASVVPPREED